MFRIFTFLLSLALSLGLCGPFVVAIDGQPSVVEIQPFSDITQPPTPEIITPVPTDPPLPTPTPCIISPLIPDYINLRELPSTSATIVGQMPAGQVVPDSYYSNGLVWYHYDDVWVAAVGSLLVEGACANLPFVDPF